MDRKREIKTVLHFCSGNGHLTDDGNNMARSFHILLN